MTSSSQHVGGLLLRIQVVILNGFLLSWIFFLRFIFNMCTWEWYVHMNSGAGRSPKHYPNLPAFFL